jgi:hypothetical protein
MKKLNLALTLAAGLAGGAFSHYLWPQTVQAQTQPAAPKEVRAQSFVLVNDQGAVVGTFSADMPVNGTPSIKLYDGTGREIWRAGGSPVRPLASR